MEKLSNKLSTVNDFAELKRESSYHKPQTHDSSSSSSGGFLSSCSRMALCIILCYLRLVFSVQLHKKKEQCHGLIQSSDRRRTAKVSNQIQYLLRFVQT